jgi:hypothetical protein
VRQVAVCTSRRKIALETRYLMAEMKRICGPLRYIHFHSPEELLDTIHHTLDGTVDPAFARKRVEYAILEPSAYLLSTEPEQENKALMAELKRYIGVTQIHFVGDMEPSDTILRDPRERHHYITFQASDRDVLRYSRQKQVEDSASPAAAKGKEEDIPCVETSLDADTDYLYIRDNGRHYRIRQRDITCCVREQDGLAIYKGRERICTRASLGRAEALLAANKPVFRRFRRRYLINPEHVTPEGIPGAAPDEPTRPDLLVLDNGLRIPKEQESP